MTFLRNRLRSREGFTLVELIVVVAILGILAVVLTPKVLGAIDNAKTNGAQATGKALQLGMERYLIAKNSYPAEGSGADQIDTFDDLDTVLSGYVNLKDADFVATAFDYAPTGTGGTSNYSLTVTLNGSAKKLVITPTSITVTD